MFFNFRTITQTIFLNGIPTIVPTSTPSAGIGFNGSGPNPSGGATTADQQATFTWHIVDDGAVTGRITNGPANRIGSSIRQTGASRQVLAGQGLANHRLTNENIQIETRTTTLLDGMILTPLPRICHRERVLRKL
jgi:hypothetical protein